MSGRFQSRIGDRRHHLGNFRTAEEAAHAYNLAALSKDGPSAPLNKVGRTKATHLFVARVGGAITSRCGTTTGTTADLRAQWLMRKGPEITCVRCLNFLEKTNGRS